MQSASNLVATLGTPTVSTPAAGMWQGDALALLRRVPAETVHLVLTSPPYNIAKPYEKNLPLSEYVAWCAQWLEEIARVLTPTGAAWINLGYLAVPEQGTAVPIPYLLWPHLPMHLMQEVVWQQSNGVACRRRLSPRNEKLLWLVKDPKRYVFNLDAIRDPNVLYPAQRRNGRLRCNPLGKNPGDVWAIARVTAGRRTAERTDHPAQMPLELARRVVLVSSNPGDTVLDPFAGSASALVAATQLGRLGYGFELCTEYVDIARRRLIETVA